jgi:hypothetical protein
MSELLEMRRLAAIALLCLLAPALSPALARADTVSGDEVRIDFRGSILPRVLPRSGPAPVSLHVEGRVEPLGAEHPAALSRLTIQVNRHAVFSARGLPRCPRRKLRGTSSEEALANCGEALIGSGYFTSHIDIPEQAPFPAWGRVLAFNTQIVGREAVAIHVFGRKPAATSTLLSAALSRSGRASGQFGPKLSIVMPKIGDDWGYVSGFGLTLHRRSSPPAAASSSPMVGFSAGRWAAVAGRASSGGPNRLPRDPRHWLRALSSQPLEAAAA